MVAVTFTYYARRLPTGQHQVHLFIKEVGFTGDGGSVRETNDAVDIVRKIVGDNADPNDPDSRLLQSGEPDASYFPIFMFVIGVTWNRDAKCGHYTRVCYERYEWDAKWNPIAALGMEQYEYTMSCLKKYERKRLVATKRSVAS